MKRTIIGCLVLMGAAGGPLPDVSQLPQRKGLPDPLVMMDGTRVTEPSRWHNHRRPELLRLFQHYMYGDLPHAPSADAIRFEKMREDRGYFGGKATLKLITIRYHDAAPPIHLLLVTPNAKPHAPVFLGLNFGGNHTTLPDPSIPLTDKWVPSRYPGVKDNKATDAARGTRTDRWPIEKVIDRGYGVATFYCGDIDPDKPDFTDGIHPHFLKSGQTAPGPHEWGTIAAWAWGLHRAVDYLITDRDVDRARIVVIGHSRLGKTALLAAAFDERIAIAIPSQSGTGGASPSRSESDKAESVERINTNFPHWFNDTYPLFNTALDRLPFDQHCLIALVAPRPVLLSNASEDLWANPAGQFKMLRAATPVYELLGVEGLKADAMPEPGSVPDALIDSRLGYFIRPGKHDMTWTEWEAWIAFAGKWFAAGR